MFSLISRPLNDFKDIYYPSFAEWVTCKVYAFAFLLCSNLNLRFRTSCLVFYLILSIVSYRFSVNEKTMLMLFNILIDQDKTSRSPCFRQMLCVQFPDGAAE